MVEDGGDGGCGVAEDEGGGDGFAVFLVGDREGHGFRHAGVRHQRVVDLDR